MWSTPPLFPSRMLRLGIVLLLLMGVAEGASKPTVEVEVTAAGTAVRVLGTAPPWPPSRAVSPFPPRILAPSGFYQV